MSTAAHAGEIAVRGIQLMADGERADFDELIHPDAVNQEGRAEPPECRVGGPAGYYATALWLRTAFAGLAYDVHQVVADGNLMAVHVTMRGRHVAPFVVWTPDGEVDTAFPPTGKEFAVTQSHWLRVRDGQIVEHWANRDDLGQAQQLGWVPPTPGYLLRMARAKARARRAAA
ncbi:ester cyclase [Kribbella sp. NPDC059898]|uniref:ester cyclase n=1 Tax=Kribbella sp. NPDC059898 TaxID=3346995 RepID=UPI00365017D6